MKFYQETTDYRDKVANGVYLLSDDKTKMYAYVAPGQKSVKKFKNFIRIDTRGRKFTAVPNTYGFKIEEEQYEGRVWTVKGSKGDEYKVTESGGNFQCSCSGFRFRGACKHVESIRVAV